MDTRTRRPRGRCPAWLVGVLFVSLAPRITTAAVFYVRAAGDDGADGRTPASAFATITRGTAAVRNPADRVIVGPGVYREGNLAPARSGFEGHAVELLGDATGQATGDPPGEVRVEPPAASTTGFLLAGMHHVLIEGFTIVGGVDAGVQVRPDVDGVPSADITIRAVETRGSAKRGIDVTAGGTIVIEECRAISNGASGISLVGVVGAGTRLQVVGNVATGNGVHGIFVADAVGGVVDSNEVRDNQESGILVRSSDGIDIVGNTAVGNRLGIAAGAGSEPEAVVGDVIVRDNEVRTAREVGIDVATRGTATLVANAVTGSGVSGVLVVGVGAAGLALEDNTVTQSGGDGVLVRDLDTLTSRANAVEENQGAGVRVQRARNVTLNADTLAANGEPGLDVVARGRVSVRNTRIEDNGGAGASVVAEPGGGLRLDLVENVLADNDGSGLFVSGAVGGLVAGNTVSDADADGMTVRSSRGLVLRDNRIERSRGYGVIVGTAADAAPGSDFRLDDNRVNASGQGGIAVFASGAVAAVGNRVTRSEATGLAVEGPASPVRPVVSNNTVGTSGAHGIFVRGATDGLIQNNVSFSHADTGLTVRQATGVRVLNNLVYANAHDGVAIGTGDEAVVAATIAYNTLYANMGWGLLLGTSLAASTGATVVGNIVAENRGGPAGRGGIAVAGASTCGYAAGFNLNTDGYGEGTPRNSYDLADAPLFMNPAGPDGRLGGDAFEDDDLRLQQRRGGQTVSSPAVDAGPLAATEVGLTGSTAVGGLADIGRADLGYHYGAAAAQRVVVSVPFMPLFVRVGGDDAGDARDPLRALGSIQAAAEHADAGVTIVVGPGHYRTGDIHPDQRRGRVRFVADTSGLYTGELPGPVLVDADGYDTGFVLLNACDVEIQGFAVTGALSAGIQVRAGSERARISANVVFSNQRRGIEVVEAPAATLDNNLVYGNGTGGLRVETAPDAVLVNNTVYANGDVGILVGGSAPQSAAPGARLLRNVVAGNGVGIRVQDNSSTGYVSAFNVVPDGFAGSTPRDDSDFVPDPDVPLFIDPVGVDGQLGGAGFADDDFHLVQVTDNPAVDVDYGAPDVLAAGSTERNGRPDVGPADAGYHYAFVPRFPDGARLPTVVYVRATGRDDNDGTTPARALASLAAGLSAVQRGGMVVVGPGHYREPQVRIGGAGAADAVVAVFGDTAGALTGDAPGAVVIDGDGVGVSTVSGRAVVDGLTFTGSRGPGLRVLRQAGPVVVRHARACGNPGDGMSVSGHGVALLNNLLCGNGRSGIVARMVRARQWLQLVNNTVVGNHGRGVVVHETGAAASHTVLFNNIVAGNTGVGVTAAAVAGIPPARGTNLNDDGEGPRTVAATTDQARAPQFAGGAADGRPVGCEWTDAYRLMPDSPGLDAGTGVAAMIGLGTRSARVAAAVDVGPVDVGVHYVQ